MSDLEGTGLAGYGINKEVLAGHGLTGSLIITQTVTDVWILSTSVLPQPPNINGTWDDSDTWDDTAVWYD